MLVFLQIIKEALTHHTTLRSSPQVGLLYVYSPNHFISDSLQSFTTQSGMKVRDTAKLVLSSALGLTEVNCIVGQFRKM